jgi:hypothetical protein
MTVTDSQTENDSFPRVKKREIDWAQYLDYTLFFESGELKNVQLDKFRNDLSY